MLKSGLCPETTLHSFFWIKRNETKKNHEPEFIYGFRGWTIDMNADLALIYGKKVCFILMYVCVNETKKPEGSLTKGLRRGGEHYADAQ